MSRRGQADPLVIGEPRHAYAVQKDGLRVLMPVLDQRNPSVIEIAEK